KGLRRQLVARLASFAFALDQACLAERSEVLRDSLARHLQLRGQLRGRRGSALRQRLDDVAPIRIGQGVEDTPRGVAHAYVIASARSSSAIENSGVDSRTCSLVPSSVSSSVNSVSPSSSQSSTSRSGGSATTTVARRSSPSSQRKTPAPPSRGSSSTSFAYHSSSWSGSVSASQTSSGGTGNSISRVTSSVSSDQQPKGCVY